MSSSKDNNIYKKTSFLAGSNSSFIEDNYSKYLTKPDSLPEGWRIFFDGLNEEKDIIYKNIKGPSWSPKKVDKKIKISLDKKNIEEKKDEEISQSTEQATKDSVRAIMLIRAYRIRGHLIANLDPLKIQIREEHQELKPETYGFYLKDYNRKIFLDGVLGLQYANLKEILEILKKHIVPQLVMNLCIWGTQKKKAG